jgi:beta-galactosidase/beta-glucuronidase
MHLAAAETPPAENWKPVSGHLMTRWAKDVDPQKPLPEYPRPQMDRKEWTNLNGLWDYAVTNLAAPKPEKFDGQILVPFCIESALSGVKKPLTAKERLWYHRTFAAPALIDGKRLLLHFGAVDWEAKVSVNGKPVAEHRGGYDTFNCDITDAVKPGAGNELTVCVFDATGGMQPRGKQSFNAIANPGGIFYTPCSGIWQTVWLETVPAAYISRLHIVPDLDDQCVRGTVETSGNIGGMGVSVEVMENGRVLAVKGGSPSKEIVVPITNPKLWSPDSPFLYDLGVMLGKEQDRITSYFGMRKISLGKDDKGHVRLMLNNQFMLQVGLLDQGYWPDGIYTAPTDEALRFDIEIAKKLGMNVIRKHVKVEPDRWYYWCDKLGLIIWQDMPNGGAGKGMSRGRASENKLPHDGLRVSDAANAQLEAELKAMVQGLWNHPSIVMWVVFNEGNGQYDTPRLANWVKELDPSRLVDNASGYLDFPAGDVIDMHAYPGAGCPKSDGKRAPVLGEFGGLGLIAPDHRWVDKNWGYKAMADANELTQKYTDLLRTIYALKDSDGLNACVYTQTTDVECEINGLLTYDREIIKPDVEKIAAASRGIFTPSPVAPGSGVKK